MKWILSFTICYGIIIAAGQIVPKRDAVVGENPYGMVDTTFDQQKAISDLMAKIEGQEEKPAEEVFANIQIFKGVPAGRLIRIMEMGFARSLGVDCTHCHNPLVWDSDELRTKGIAREMFVMVQQINGELLTKIEGFADRQQPAFVNCTTCHRGEVKPALNIAR